MTVSAICPHCSKTISFERANNFVCPECGADIYYPELQRKRLLIDKAAEKAAMESASEYFVNTEFRGAYENFKKALDANKNSYSAQYFVLLCDIYLHETEKDYDFMGNVISMIKTSLDVMKRANAPAPEKLSFLVAMLSETKILITRRLVGRDDLFESDINKFRKLTIADLSTLLELFKIDREVIMSFSPEVINVLSEIADCALRACYKAVQTVMVDGKIYTPSDEEYKKLLGLCNDYCFFAQEVNPYFNALNYSPDFTQNNELIEKVREKFKKFDEENKYAKKNIIVDIAKYDAILAECEKALRLTYLNCYKSMCSRQNKQHAQLFVDGMKILYRLLLPRVVLTDKKKITFRTAKFVDMLDWCDMLTRFLVDSYEFYDGTAASLHDFYEKLYDMIKTYFVPEFERISKNINKLKEAGGENYNYAVDFLYNGACACALALEKYIDFSDGRDTTRIKLVKLCKAACEDFFVLCKMGISELEQSNFYRPILKISSALMEEEA